MSSKNSVVPVESIEQCILSLRGYRVMLDSDLAGIYGVTTKRLNEQVRRNLERFPEDFMFQLTAEETESLRSHFATSNSGRGGRRYLPYVFTEHGAVMLANVLKSPTAIQASIQVVRAFVRLRQMVIEHSELSRRLDELEAKYDAHFKVVFAALRKLMQPPATKQRRVGFRVESSAEGRTRLKGKRLR